MTFFAVKYVAMFNVICVNALPLKSVIKVFYCHIRAKKVQKHSVKMPYIEFKPYKFKKIPLQAWSGPECSRKLRFPDFMTTAQDDGRFVSFTHRPSLPPGNAPGTHFC